MNEREKTALERVREGAKTYSAATILVALKFAGCIMFYISF